MTTPLPGVGWSGPGIDDMTAAVLAANAAAAAAATQGASITEGSVDMADLATAVADLINVGAVGSNQWLIECALVQAWTITSASYDANGAIITASVTWPDGTIGTFTTTTASSALPGAVDAFHVTYVGSTTKTVTQSAVTRDSTTGQITVQPTPVVS